MRDMDNLPDLYTQREIEKARSRNRWLGRVEGVAGVIAVGAIMNLLGWIPTVLVVVLAGYVLWRLLSKKDPDEDV